MAQGPAGQDRVSAVRTLWTLGGRTPGSLSRRWSRPELCSPLMKGAGGEPRARSLNLLGFQIRSI